MLPMYLFSSFLGNLFEHYDTALFGFLSPFLAPLIFPTQDPLTALILTYALIPLGMLARPLGSLVFGYIGDIYGRRPALFFSLAGMAIVSGSIALTPTYAQVGLLAPILFSLGRVLLNFLAAGETMGGAIFLLENVSEKRHDFISSLYGASTLGGHLLASLGVFLLTQREFIDPGWRFLYLCGCFTVLFGCLLRRSAPAPSSMKKVPQTTLHINEVFRKYRKPLFLLMIGAGFSHATYAIAIVLMNGFIPLVSSLTVAEAMKINTYLLILDFLALPFFGWVASKLTREKLMLAASLASVLFAIPLLISLEGASLGRIVWIRTVFVLFGVAYCAPFYAWAQHLIPSTHRYGVISMGYTLGSQLLGTPTAALTLWCFQKTGMVSSLAWYWMILGSASSLSILMTMRSKKEVFNTN